ncbi:MAG TPA: sigma-70 family RNA polymerase sigma factor [Eoetvoesiella sp.]|uniref:sigma-70 family RNA polymerase sigma factor n=1 Tax=Eoetvoesiella sp. TaxID=1966355 RepID=UPI002B9498DB|nr:sigma-70 family RNA polymerase sigma factor [Eoetvoesiella sp.]HWK62800.1 sigma-70 family RNA polymerase sigma factor [Eoetvoesiella sp.]
MLAQNFDYEAALAACARGSQAALRDLYHRETPQMLALATRMLADGSAAEAVVRDTFVLIWKNAASYDPQAGTARAWIYSIMRYRAMNRLRQSGRIVPAAKAGWQARLPVLSNTADSAPLARTLNKLEQAQRLPILMAYYGGLNYEQIGALLHMPQEQVKSHAHTALAAILDAEQA